MVSQFHSAGLRVSAATAVMLVLLSFCACSDSNPAAPNTGLYHPVQESSQIEGAWRAENIFAGGLPVAGWLVPGPNPGVADSKLLSFFADLAVSKSGTTTGVFSTDVRGEAADTADVTSKANGGQRTSGGYTLWGEGQIEILLTAENGKTLPTAKKYLGTASTLGDTLLLEFRFSVPAQKAVPFLPDTLSFLARMVRR